MEQSLLATATCDDVARWIEDALSADGLDEEARIAAAVVRNERITARVLHSLTNDDVRALFSALSFGCQRYVIMLAKQVSTPMPFVLDQSKRAIECNDDGVAKRSRLDENREAAHDAADDAVFPNRANGELPVVDRTEGSVLMADSNLYNEDRELTVPQVPSELLDREAAPNAPAPAGESAVADRPEGNILMGDVNADGAREPIVPQLPSELVHREAAPINPAAADDRASEALVDRPEGNVLMADANLKDDPEPIAPQLPPEWKRMDAEDEFLLGICGPTGAGKSTVLNAILDGCDILPTSCLRACTAVVIEVRYKPCVAPKQAIVDAPVEDLDQWMGDEVQADAVAADDLLGAQSEDTLYVAEIEFISLEEWRSMLTSAVAVSIRDRERVEALRASIVKSREDGDMDASAALLEGFALVNDAMTADATRVRNVFHGKAPMGSVDEYEKLSLVSEYQAVLAHLGQTIRFNANAPLDISRRIARFLASSSSASIWPLVRRARIFGPWALLSSGLVLVDLPGLGDADAARNTVVDGYIDRCNGIIAVAPISRARDNKTTKDLLNDRVKVGVRDGRVKFVAFVATHSDNIDPREIADELGPSFAALYKQGVLPTGMQPSEQLCSNAELDRLATRRNNAAMYQGADGELDAIDEEIARKMRIFRSECVLARNGSIQNALTNQYREEMVDAISVRTCKAATVLKVFAVSPVEYIKIMRSGGCADVSMSFCDVQATGMPSLLRSLWTLAGTSSVMRAQGERDTNAAFAPANSAALNDDEDQEGGEANEDEDDGDAEASTKVASYLQEILRDEEGDLAAEPNRLQEAMQSAAAESAARRKKELADAAGVDIDMQERAAYLKEIIARNDLAAKSISVFMKASEGSLERVASTKRVKIWADQVAALDASAFSKASLSSGSMPDAPTAMIAILGDSGSGKSSCLNAILGTSDGGVLPVSGVRACTAAPIEISYLNAVQFGVASYEATVVFLSAEEWHTELEQLISDLMDMNGQLPRNMARPTGASAKVAYDKIMSVYGRIAMFKDLVRKHSGPTEARLGSTVRLKSSSASGIRFQLEQFVSSKSQVSGVNVVIAQNEIGRLWPIVKCAYLKGPFPVLADSGGRLLDLPGLMDSNAARNAVVASFLTSCNGFLIAAPIRRAVDNRTARDLLGRQFRRQLLLDGRMGSVAFVATQTDDIDAFQLKKELGGPSLVAWSGMDREEVVAAWSKQAPLIASLRKRLQTLNKKAKHWEGKASRERAKLKKLFETKEPSEVIRQRLVIQRAINKFDATAKEIRAAVTKVAVRLRTPEHILNHICATARNGFARVQLRRDFAEGIAEITDASGIVAEGPAIPDLPVFTVSSRDYQVLLKKKPDEANSFFTTEQTGIPLLYQYCRHSLLVSRIAAEAARSDRLELLMGSINQYLSLSERASPAQQAALIKQTTGMLTSVDAEMDTAVKRTQDRLRSLLLAGPLGEALSLGDAKARRVASSVLSDQESRIHWATYRAAIKRKGEYTSPSAGYINVNDTLAAPMLDTAMGMWREAFGSGVNKVIQRMSVHCATIADKALADVIDCVKQSGLSVAPLINDLGSDVRRSFELGMNDLRTSLTGTIEDSQREAWRLLSQTIRTSLEPGYNLGAAEAGTGCVARLKGHMRDCLNDKKRTMYHTSLSRMQSSIGAMVKRAAEIMTSALKSRSLQLMQSVEIVWDAEIELSEVSCASLVEVLAPLSKFCAHVNAGAFALAASIDKVDFDHIDSSCSLLPRLAPLPLDALIAEAPLHALIPQRPAAPARHPHIQQQKPVIDFEFRGATPNAPSGGRVYDLTLLSQIGQSLISLEDVMLDLFRDIPTDEVNAQHGFVLLEVRFRGLVNINTLISRVSWPRMQTIATRVLGRRPANAPAPVVDRKPDIAGSNANSSSASSVIPRVKPEPGVKPRRARPFTDYMDLTVSSDDDDN